MKWVKKYVLRMVIGMVAYALGLIAVCYFFPEQSPRHWLFLVPVMAAIIYIAAIILRAISDMDEMWRKGVTEAFAFSAIATGFTCFGYRFVREAVGAPEFHAEWAFYLMWVYYGIGALASWWRSR
jgi:uncharacterized membrane protein HdeD (DUF308 family)